MKSLNLTDLIDVQILQQIQNGFSEFAGMAALTADALGRPVTEGSGFSEFCTEMIRQSELGRKRCEECDRRGALQACVTGEASIYECHAGLVDYAAPIMVDGQFVGSFIGGQVRVREIDEERMREIAREMEIDPEEYVEAARRTPLIDRETVQRTAAFLTEIAKILSEMAYRNYKALQNSRQMEQAALSQASFITTMILDMKRHIQEWMSITDQALGNEDQQEVQRLLNQLRANSGSVLSEIEDTINYINVSDGNVQLDEREYNIDELIEQIEMAAEKLVRGRDIRVNINRDQSVPEYLLGDSGNIGQVIFKLMQHSISHMDCGEIQIQISCRRISYSVWLEIEIRDNGEGMYPEDLERIREFLWSHDLQLIKCENSVETSLYVLGVLIHQMSGTVNVQSVRGVGTVFRIGLPQLEVRGGVSDGV